MRPRRKSALLWGVIGALVFLVLAQGAVLFGLSLPIGIPALLGVAVGVGVLAAAVTYVAEHRLTGKGQA